MTTLNKTTAVAKKPESAKASAMVEIIPYGSKEAFKLSVAMVKTMLAVKTKKGVMPSDDDCIKFIALCQARKLNPFEGDAYMIGYDTNDGPKFNLITAHQAFLKRAELNNEFNGMKSGVIVERDGKLIDLEGDFHLESDKVVGGWACVYFKTRQQPMMKRVRLKRFQKPFGIWQDDPAGMICKCAEADALRSSFPTMCGGMYMKEEYKEDQPNQTTLAAPIFTQQLPPGEPVNVEDPMIPENEPLSGKDRIRVLCKESGITEEDLIDYLGNIDLAEVTDTKIDQLKDEAVEQILEKWEAIAQHIEEVTSNQ